jgi:hypothetical protein
MNLGNEQLVERLTDYYQSRLSLLLCESAYTGAGSDVPKIRFCHRLQNGEGRAWGGLSALLVELVIKDDSERLPATLVFGFLPKETVLQQDEVAKIFEWPGVQYLFYSVSDDVLLAAARSAIEGAKQPLPNWREIEVRKNLLILSAEIRHWLENRMRNTELALSDFESAMRGEIRLHRTHLEPVTAISENHQAMLDRLWMLEISAGRFAPRTGGLGPLKAGIAGFKTSWQALEAARAALLASGEAEVRAEHIKEVVIGFRRVRDALSTAIMATRELDNEMITREGN